MITKDNQQEMNAVVAADRVTLGVMQVRVASAYKCGLPIPSSFYSQLLNWMMQVCSFIRGGWPTCRPSVLCLPWFKRSIWRKSSANE